MTPKTNANKLFLELDEKMLKNSVWMRNHGRGQSQKWEFTVGRQVLFDLIALCNINNSRIWVMVHGQTVQMMEMITGIESLEVYETI